MASRLTIRCRNAEEAETLLDLLKARMADPAGLPGLRPAAAGATILVESGEPGQPVEMPKVAPAIAETVAEWMVAYQEPRVVRGMMTRRVTDMDEGELEELVEICFRALNGPRDAGGQAMPAMRKAGVARKLSGYLREHAYLDLNGFYRFRLADYHSCLSEAVEYALEEFVADRQYREFISLLKYFVYFQDIKIPKANLIHCGDNRYAMLDHRMQPLEWCGTEEVTVEKVDRELNYEDMIVSTLISASPRHITIHTREPDTLSIRTIRQIFEGRTTLCTSCKLCKPYLDREEGIASLDRK